MDATDPQLRVGEIVAGRYRLTRAIGAGGMGAVFEAEHLVTHRHVAVKLMHRGMGWSAESVERFLREARVATTIGHPNIIEVLDAGMAEDQTPYMVLSLLRGENLAKLLEREGPLDYRAALALVAPVLEALVAAHAVGVIHRDIKPENVFVSRDARGAQTVTLLDFGISKIVGDGSPLEHRTLTKSGSILGTPDYMSPEQVRGDDDIDARADVWAIGVVLYRLLTGVMPFEAKNASMIIYNVLAQEPVPVASLAPGLPQEVAALVHAALVKDRALRLLSAAEQLLRVRAILGAPDGSPTHGASAPPAPRTSAPDHAQAPRAPPDADALAATLDAPPDSVPPVARRATPREPTPTEGAMTALQTPPARGSREPAARTHVAKDTTRRAVPLAVALVALSALTLVGVRQWAHSTRAASRPSASLTSAAPASSPPEPSAVVRAPGGSLVSEGDASAAVALRVVPPPAPPDGAPSDGGPPVRVVATAAGVARPHGRVGARPRAPNPLVAPPVAPSPSPLPHAGPAHPAITDLNAN